MLSEREQHNWEKRREQLSALLDNELAEAERAALAAHLQGCAACRAELESLRRTRALLGAVPQPALPRSFLLPVEPAPQQSAGELAGVARPGQRPSAASAPAPSAPRAERPPVPLSAARSDRLNRSVQVVRWLSTIAAIFGLLLLCGSVLATFASLHAGGASTASAPGLSARTPNQNQGSTAQGNTPPVENTPKVTNPGATSTAFQDRGSPTATAGGGETGGATPSPTQSENPSTGSGAGFALSTPELGLLLLGLGVVGLVAAATLRRIGASTGR
jgi:anti-sigma factor RsiW